MVSNSYSAFIITAYLTWGVVLMALLCTSYISWRSTQKQWKALQARKSA
jgi:hypothetical protein